MEIRDERPHVPRAVRLAAVVEPFVLAHQDAHVVVPQLFVRVVHRHVPAVIGNRDVRVREQELADRGIEREAVDALAGRVHEHRTRAVNYVPRRHLAAARLEHVLKLAVTSARDLPDDGEDRSHGNVYVDVRRAIERIEEQTILAALEVLRDLNDAWLLFGRHGAQPAAVIHRLDDDLIGQNVELLLHFTLHVLGFRGTQDVRQPGASYFVRDHLRGNREVVKDSRQLAGGFGMQPLFFDDETVDGDHRRCGMFDHGNHPFRVEANDWRTRRAANARAANARASISKRCRTSPRRTVSDR